LPGKRIFHHLPSFFVGVFCETNLFGSNRRARTGFDVHCVRYGTNGRWYGRQWFERQWFNGARASKRRIARTYGIRFTRTHGNGRTHAGGKRIPAYLRQTHCSEETARLITGEPFFFVFAALSRHAAQHLIDFFEMLRLS
jgi:hypothetical protein